MLWGVGGGGSLMPLIVGDGCNNDGTNPFAQSPLLDIFGLLAITNQLAYTGIMI